MSAGPTRSLRVFLSYASEHNETAEQIYLTLSNAGHDVFFDRTSLPPGRDYNPAILDRIRSSDLMVFLISPESVEDGSYARTEIRFARDVWPEPQGRLLPVMVADTPRDSIPMYVRAVTYMTPEGSIAAEVAAAVNDLAAGIVPSETFSAHREIVRETAERVSIVASEARRSSEKVDRAEARVETVEGKASFARGCLFSIIWAVVAYFGVTILATILWTLRPKNLGPPDRASMETMYSMAVSFNCLGLVVVGLAGLLGFVRGSR